uniref:Thioredoxin domain-containing protein n=1 Tax=Oxyrrhis marina TaxID=2969 RepID=A0A7S3UQY9_OXYMA|mmetsp:Transcript_5994/g.14297  ORF Transcript_5994/g.14297 Transcript_5994/m.14297 type:complete len:134 (-) Transcript_5994:296-697(-)
MAPKEIVQVVTDPEAFRALVEDETNRKLHLVDVYTEWCGPCQQMIPTFKGLQLNIDAFEDRVTITQIPLDVFHAFCALPEPKIPMKAEDFPSTSQPRFLFFRDGQLLDDIKGAHAPRILKTINEQMPGLDHEE